MKTIQTTVYSFDELTDEAKAKARTWWRDCTAQDGYSNASDAIKSIEKLAEHFNGKVKQYSIDWFNTHGSWMTFDVPEMDTEDTEDGAGIASRIAGLGAANKETGRGLGDCVLTGCYTDEEAIDGLRTAYNGGERDLAELMQAAFCSLVKSCEADAIWQNEDAQVDEIIEANEYTFTADGKRFG